MKIKIAISLIFVWFADNKDRMISVFSNSTAICNAAIWNEIILNFISKKKKSKNFIKNHQFVIIILSLTEN